MSVRKTFTARKTPRRPFMRMIPDALTILRLVVSPLLLLAVARPPFFVALYLLGGISDAADGFLARKLHAESKTGQQLDSAADFFFLFCALFAILPRLTLSSRRITILAAIAAVRVFSLSVGFIRFGQLVSLHTRAAKCTGLLIFLYPLFLPFAVEKAAFAVCAAIAAFASLEEAAIGLSVPFPDRDAPSLSAALRPSLPLFRKQAG